MVKLKKLSFVCFCLTLAVSSGWSAPSVKMLGGGNMLSGTSKAVSVKNNVQKTDSDVVRTGSIRTVKPVSAKTVSDNKSVNDVNTARLSVGKYLHIYVDKVQRGSIEGDNTPFTQYFSVRKTKRSCGTIDITAHFDGWKSLGLELGNSMYEAKVLGEAGQYPENGNASGTIDFAYAKVYTGEASTALHAPKLKAFNEQNLKIFDMQGQFLGTISTTQSKNLSKAIKNKVHNAGVYMVKQGNSMKSVVIK